VIFVVKIKIREGLFVPGSGVNKNRPLQISSLIQAALAAALSNFHYCLVFIMSPLQGFGMVG
jgi:hypothetical protein